MKQARSGNRLSYFVRAARIMLTPRNALLKSRLRNGVVVYGRNRAGHGGRGIYLDRDRIEPEFDYLDRFVEPGFVFIDIGANTGIYSSKAAREIGPEGLVIAIEPTPFIFTSLVQTVRANGFTNVRLRNLCCGRSTGVADFYQNFERPVAFSLKQHDPEATPFNVLSVTLDDLLSWESVERVDFIKMDVEGAEADVIAGAKRVVTSYRPIILAEVHLADFDIGAENYAIVSAPGSPNKMFIPLERTQALETASSLGWQRHDN